MNVVSAVNELLNDVTWFHDPETLPTKVFAPLILFVPFVFTTASKPHVPILALMARIRQ